MARVKEPHFFAWEGRPYDLRGPGVQRVGREMVKELDAYLNLFSGAKGETIRGEASTGYLHTEGVPQRIKHHVADAKLLAILRNPIDRAYSSFLHARRLGFEPISDFQEALDVEPERIENRWIGLTLYVSVGMYAEQLHRYMAHFPSEQMRIYLHDDFTRDPISVTQDAFRFLRVSDSFEPNTASRHNEGSSVRSVRLESLVRSRLLSSLAKRVLTKRARPLYWRLNVRPTESLPTQLRMELGNRFEGDVTRLSRMLNRDLTPWLEGEPVPPSPDGSAPGIHPAAD